jgi:hypothetical protein
MNESMRALIFAGAVVLPVRELISVLTGTSMDRADQATWLAVLIAFVIMTIVLWPRQSKDGK